MTQSSDRLDRIERSLEQVVTNQLDLQQSIAQVDQRLETSITELQQSIAKVDQRLEATITETASMIAQAIEDAGTEREVFQAEIRRIWEYLLNQQPGNGRSGSQ